MKGIQINIKDIKSNLENKFKADRDFSRKIAKRYESDKSGGLTLNDLDPKIQQLVKETGTNITSMNDLRALSNISVQEKIELFEAIARGLSKKQVLLEITEKMVQQSADRQAEMEFSHILFDKKMIEYRLHEVFLEDKKIVAGTQLKRKLIELRKISATLRVGGLIQKEREEALEKKKFTQTCVDTLNNIINTIDGCKEVLKYLCEDATMIVNAKKDRQKKMFLKREEKDKKKFDERYKKLKDLMKRYNELVDEEIFVDSIQTAELQAIEKELRKEYERILKLYNEQMKKREEMKRMRELEKKRAERKRQEELRRIEEEKRKAEEKMEKDKLRRQKEFEKKEEEYFKGQSYVQNVLGKFTEKTNIDELNEIKGNIIQIKKGEVYKNSPEYRKLIDELMENINNSFGMVKELKSSTERYEKEWEKLLKHAQRIKDEDDKVKEGKMKEKELEIRKELGNIKGEIEEYIESYNNVQKEREEMERKKEELEKEFEKKKRQKELDSKNELYDSSLNKCNNIEKEMKSYVIQIENDKNVLLKKMEGAKFEIRSLIKSHIAKIDKRKEEISNIFESIKGNKEAITKIKSIAESIRDEFDERKRNELVGEETLLLLEISTNDEEIAGMVDGLGKKIQEEINDRKEFIERIENTKEQTKIEKELFQFIDRVNKEKTEWDSKLEALLKEQKEVNAMLEEAKKSELGPITCKQAELLRIQAKCMGKQHTEATKFLKILAELKSKATELKDDKVLTDDEKSKRLINLKRDLNKFSFNAKDNWTMQQEMYLKKREEFSYKKDQEFEEVEEHRVDIDLFESTKYLNMQFEVLRNQPHKKLFGKKQFLFEVDFFANLVKFMNLKKGKVSRGVEHENLITIERTIGSLLSMRLKEHLAKNSYEIHCNTTKDREVLYHLLSACRAMFFTWCPKLTKPGKVRSKTICFGQYERPEEYRGKSATFAGEFDLKVTRNPYEDAFVFCQTWNMGREKPNSREFKKAINIENKFDLYAIAVQESPWKRGLDIKSTLLNVFNTVDKKGKSFICLNSAQVGRTGLIVICNVMQAAKVSNVRASLVDFGGGRGSVGISLMFAETSILFVNSHFTPIDEKSDHSVREKQYRQTITCLMNGYKNLDFFNQFHYIFWMGDFGYHVMDVDSMKVCYGRKNPKLEKIFVGCEFNKLKKDKKIFNAFEEANITFKPTYPISKKTGDLFVKNEGKKTQVNPSYPDRILYKAFDEEELTCKKYWSENEVCRSEHKAVSAIFKLKCLLPYNNIFEDTPRQICLSFDEVTLKLDDKKDDDGEGKKKKKSKKDVSTMVGPKFYVYGHCLNKFVTSEPAPDPDNIVWTEEELGTRCEMYIDHYQLDYLEKLYIFIAAKKGRGDRLSDIVASANMSLFSAVEAMRQNRVYPFECDAYCEGYKVGVFEGKLSLMYSAM